MLFLRRIGYITCFICIYLILPGQKNHDSLRFEIHQILTRTDADVGIAVMDLFSKDTFTVHGDRHYPMQSVYKFHLALAVLNQVDRGMLKLDQLIFIKKSDLLPNTYSPLRDDYPDGNISLPLSTILQYTVSKSDNNGCDILFRLMGGPGKVNSYIQSFKVKDILISATESEMHHDWNTQFRNYSSPLACIKMLDLFYNKKILSKTTMDFLNKAMIETSTGPNKIKGLLDKNIIVAHKTGLSDTKDGIRPANNDVGILELPGGKKIAIAVFIADSKQSQEESDKVVAEIAKTIVNQMQ